MPPGRPIFGPILVAEEGTTSSFLGLGETFRAFSTDRGSPLFHAQSRRQGRQEQAQPGRPRPPAGPVSYAIPSYSPEAPEARGHLTCHMEYAVQWF